MRNSILSTSMSDNNSGYTNKSKSKKIILIAILITISLIFISGCVLAYTYFFTDTFLSADHGFYKYLSKNLDILAFFKDQDLNIYYEMTQRQSYTNQSELYLNIEEVLSESQDQFLEEINKHKILLNSNVDVTKKYNYSEMKATFNEIDVIRGAFIQQNDYLGLKIEEIGLNPYIVLENNNLKQFAKNLGLAEESIARIPDKIDFTESKYNLFTKEELMQIKDRYLKVITDNLSKDMFSVSKQDGMDVYTLTVTEEKGKVIVNALIDTLKIDTTIMDKIKQISIESGSITEAEAQTMIDTLTNVLDELKNTLNESTDDSYPGDIQTDKPINTIVEVQDKESNNLYVKVYVDNKKLLKTELSINEESKMVLINDLNKVSLDFYEKDEEKILQNVFSIGIEKNKTENDLLYKLSITGLSGNERRELINAMISFSGIKQNTNINSNIVLEIHDYSVDILTPSSQNLLEEQKRTEEKELVSLALNSLLTKYYEDTYMSDTEFEINEKNIKEYMDKQGLNMTVTKNGDATYKVVSNTTKSVYTVDSQGKLINTEHTEIEAPVEERKKNHTILTYGIDSNTTFGEIHMQELNENNMYLVNNKSKEQLEMLFTQIGERIEKKIIPIYKNTFIGQEYGIGN